MDIVEIWTYIKVGGISIICALYYVDKIKAKFTKKEGVA